MNFKPSRMKIVVSLVIIAAWYGFLLWISQKVPGICMAESCFFDFSSVSPLKMCSCPSPWSVLLVYLEILAPGLFAYAVLSFAE